MLKHTTYMFLIPLLIFSGVTVKSDEKDKEKIQIDDLFAQAQGRVAELNSGGIGPLLWRVGVSSQLAPWLNLQTSVGSSFLLFRPAWSPAPTETVSLIDIKGSVYTDIGDFYAGQFQIPWGLEGTTSETLLWLPRSLFYEKGIFPLRDLGAGFKTDYDGYFMNIAVHNGYGAGVSNSTDRMFLTGQWGYHGAAHSVLGLSATTGHLISPFYAVQDTRIRGINSFFGFNIFGLGLQLEGSIIESRNDTFVTDTVGWHGDLQHPFNDHINLIYRYESLNPNLRVGSTVLSRMYFGGEYHSLDNISRLFLFGVKNYESQGQFPGDEIQISWRIAPKFD